MELQDSAFVSKGLIPRTAPMARRAKQAADVMALKGSGMKTLKAMDRLRPQTPVKKNEDPFELEKSFGSAFKFATKTVSANARVLGASGKNTFQNSWAKAQPKVMRGMRQTKNTVTGNARAAGAIGAHKFNSASVGTKIGLSAGGGAAAGGGGMYALKRKQS